MGLSETILAAMIGAIATVSAALFQLVMAWRSRSKVDTRPKKGTALRSVVSIMALMVASAAGGFLYSEFLKQRNAEDMRAMRDELKELRTFIAQGREPVHGSDAPGVQQAGMVLPIATQGVEDTVESIAYVPACRRADASTACAEADAQRIALCGTVPAYARVDRIELFAQPDAVQHPWESHKAALEQDLGGARFTGKSFEYAQANDLKAVCVNFMQWSSDHPHIARVLVQYGFGDAPQPAEATPPAAPAEGAQSQGHAPAVVAADSPPAIPSATSLATPVSSR
ncbi:MAG TPA: hypothetical protein VFV69_18565 [Steroidobacteraceae bacterium]|jgi:hypothetical protein|nr:hypothetical protein [Steroidobacteraceae bacterium]